MDRKTSKELNSRNNYYFPKRRILHRKIVAGLLEGYPSQSAPEINFMGGGTAVGKSMIRDFHLEELGEIGKDFIIIDCDRIKPLIPEYVHFLSEDKESAADRVQAESSDINDMLLEKALLKKAHILFDGTMKDSDYYGPLIQRIRALGYIVSAVIVHAPIEVAFMREEERFLIEKRRVPEHAIRDSHQRVSRSFMELKPLFDAYRLWDNSVQGSAPKVILKKLDRDSEEVTIDLVKVEEFFGKKV
ncbi:zeta toxin family protein [Paenibacillus borealis]|uniref:UDP-N-acetylglucosamine kinase n=1 Tax=Paenibacillus borealis TaxID=160799 RepID=A0A089L7H7_PAEBO|nr:zeta toxin family protein [Paenibacillus borealis]AIQ56020.1 hypothetical protein PBOR_02865 [Paenibacillus borealis]